MHQTNHFTRLLGEQVGEEEDILQAGPKYYLFNIFCNIYVIAH